MGSLLDTMAGDIYAGFRGKLHKGVIRKLSGGAGQDGHGRPTDQTPTYYPLEGFVDGYSLFTRAQAGIPNTDLRVNIFAASIKTPGIRPAKDDLVRIDTKAGSQWYKLRGEATDPATALWDCQGFAVEAPADED